MATTEQELDSFVRFAKERLGRGGGDLVIDELFDQWRLLHPPAEDVLAIKASIRDMENGERGRSFQRFAEEFRERNIGPERRDA
jgi:hypothetical protein